MEPSSYRRVWDSSERHGGSSQSKCSSGQRNVFTLVIICVSVPVPYWCWLCSVCITWSLYHSLCDSPCRTFSLSFVYIVRLDFSTVSVDVWGCVSPVVILNMPAAFGAAVIRAKSNATLAVAFCVAYTPPQCDQLSACLRRPRARALRTARTATGANNRHRSSEDAVPDN